MRKLLVAIVLFAWCAVFAAPAVAGPPDDSVVVMQAYVDQGTPALLPDLTGGTAGLGAKGGTVNVAKKSSKKRKSPKAESAQLHASGGFGLRMRL